MLIRLFQINGRGRTPFLLGGINQSKQAKNQLGLNMDSCWILNVPVTIAVRCHRHSKTTCRTNWGWKLPLEKYEKSES